MTSALPAPPGVSAAHLGLAEDIGVSFDEFLLLDGSGEQQVWELVDGHLREKEIGVYESCVAHLLHFELRSHLRKTGQEGLVLDSEAVYRCFENGETGRRPDVSFIRPGRVSMPELRTGFLPFAPDLTAEVISPNERYMAMRGKELQYLAAGVRMHWRVDAFHREVTVMTPEGTVGPLPEQEMLRGGDVLPGFEVPIASLFLD